MAVLTIVSASVGIGGTSTNTSKNQMGEVIGQGVVVYKDTADSDNLKIADMNTILPSDVYGITVDGGPDDDISVVVTKGLIRIGSAVTAGEMYYLATTGQIGQWVDVLTGDYIVEIGHGTGPTAGPTTMIDVAIKRVVDSSGLPVLKA